MDVYELLCEDLTGLGGPMGSEKVSTIFRKAFTSEAKAKQFAEKDHKKRDPRISIVWHRTRPRELQSSDLLSHAYTISKITVR